MTYAVSSALKSLLKEKWINLLTVLTIASGLFIISLAFFVIYNVAAATKNLPDRFSMTLYLEDGASDEVVNAAIGALRKDRAVQSVRHISKNEALRELKSILKDSSYVLEGLDDNPLPATLEVKFRKETVGKETIRRLADEARRLKGISEIEYGEQFLSVLHSIRVGVETIGGIIISVLSVGIVFVCYSTVKILFYRRAEEVETFKLLGATRTFIRMPFLLEGAFLGILAGAVSLAGIFFFHYGVLQKLAISMPVLKSVLFPARQFFLLPLIGLFLGTTGAAAAIGRLRY